MTAHSINIADKREQRKFGLLMAAAFLVLGLIRWWLKGAVPSVLFGIAAAFLLLGLVAPIVLKPVFAVWMRFALILNVVVTHILLTFSFVVMFVPTRVMLMLFSNDPLKRAYAPPGESYWEPPEEQPTDPERYKNQF